MGAQKYEPVASGLGATVMQIDFDLPAKAVTLVHNAVDLQLMRALAGAALATGLDELTTAMHNQDWKEACLVALHLKFISQATGAHGLALTIAQLELAASTRQTETLFALHASLGELVSAFEISQPPLH